MTPVKVREMRPDEVPAVAALVGRVFDEHVAPLYGPEGTAEFYRYAAPAAMAARLTAHQLVLVAEDEAGDIAGMAEIRGFHHLAMFFVETDRQRQGIGKALLAALVERCRRNHPDLAEITVHASPNAVAAYARLGFLARGQEQERNGIRFTSMSLKLAGLGNA